MSPSSFEAINLFFEAILLALFMKKEQLMIVDGHVHIHSCFDIRVMLDAALNNFRRFERFEAAYFLALSESHAQNYFAALKQLAVSAGAISKSQSSKSQSSEGFSSQSLSSQSLSSQSLGDWQLSRTEDPDALVAKKHQTQHSKSASGAVSDFSIYILAGRQIVTKENLEVLALATAEQFDDGYPVEETIQLVLASGGVPVIPWGFGKWMGRRGKRLQALLKSPPVGLFLADSSSRPEFWSEPLLFEQARRAGLAILNGTDPFPLKSEMGRAGLAGFKIAGALEAVKPATSLRQALFKASHVLNKRPQKAGSALPLALIDEDAAPDDGAISRPVVYPLPAVYGPLETPIRCFRNQLAMQFIKRFRRLA